MHYYFFMSEKEQNNIHVLQLWRGVVVEWLERLDYGGSASPCGDWKTLSVNPTVNGYLFRIREG